MTYQDGAGTLTFSGFQWGANAVVTISAVVNLLPHTGDREPSLGVPLSFITDISTGGNADVQIQVASDAAFSALVWTGSLTNVVNGQHGIQPTGLAVLTLYYWRARCAPTGTTAWGDWSGTLASGLVLTPTSLSGATATASEWYGSEPPSNAIDGNAGSNFTTNGSALPQWWRVQLASAAAVSWYAMKKRNDSPGRNAKNFTFSGSNDGTTWTVLDTEVGILWPTDSMVQTFSFANTTAYLYYRIDCTVNNGDSYWSINEFTLGTSVALSGGTPWTFTCDLNAGRAYGYVYENLGIDSSLEYQGGIEYVDENVGIAYTPYAGGIEYEYSNVGVAITMTPDGIEYVYEGDVNTLTPTPHIWWLIPTSGRSGDGVSVVGFGFGDLPGTYGGVLEMLVSGVWTAVGATSWGTFPADSHGYDSLRAMDSNLGTTDMQHQVIEFIVPGYAVPPGYPVRVRTEGS